MDVCLCVCERVVFAVIKRCGDLGLLCSGLYFHNTTGRLTEGWQNKRSSLKFTSADYHNVSAFGDKTLHMQPVTHTAAFYYCHCYCLIHLKLHTRSCEVLYTAARIRRHHVLSSGGRTGIRVTHRRKVIIIWDLPLQCIVRKGQGHHAS